MLLGHHQRKLDGKKRLIIPGEFRRELGTSFAIIKNNCGYISVFSEEAMARKFEKMMAAGDDQLLNEWSREVGNNGLTVDMDSDGRITIPQEFLDYAGLSNEVVIIGCIDHAEIWSVEAYAIQFGEDKTKTEAPKKEYVTTVEKEELTRMSVKLGL